MTNYAKRNHIQLGQHYLNHVSAMTAEGLHAKSDIAAELAWRDAEIEKLRIEMQDLSVKFDLEICKKNVEIKLLRIDLEKLNTALAVTSQGNANIKNKLAESQAREAKLRAALEVALDVVNPCEWPHEENVIAYALALPTDDTVLREYRKQVLLEAADWFVKYDPYWTIPKDELRRMTEE